MQDLALHTLDVAENSLRAGATHIGIRLQVDEARDRLILGIEDDGWGMDGEILKKAASPFFTGKSAKRFGLGLSLLAQAAEDTGGCLSIDSAPGRGTRVRAEFHPSHIDMKPLGDFSTTLKVLRETHPEIEFSFEYEEIGLPE